MTGLLDVAKARFRRSIDLPQQFFAQEAQTLSIACLEMARRFHRGGRLLAFGAGNAVTDAQHISVEFVHPVIVGKRALPALALGTDIAATVGMAGTSGWDQVYARQIAALARPDDIAIGIDPAGDDGAVRSGLKTAKVMGLLVIALVGGEDLPQPNADFCFAVPTNDRALAQEIHETLYHILWELVHVFFEYRALLEG